MNLTSLLDKIIRYGFYGASFIVGYGSFLILHSFPVQFNPTPVEAFFLKIFCLLGAYLAIMGLVLYMKLEEIEAKQ